MLSLVLALSASPTPADPCTGVAVAHPTPAERRDAAALVTGTGQQTDDDAIGTIAMADSWMTVFATPREGERGVFFFRKVGGKWELVEIWGGVAGPEERDEVASWARSLQGGGAPAALANCFAARIIAGE